jgi:hypothetical protein
VRALISHEDPLASFCQTPRLRCRAQMASGGGRHEQQLRQFFIAKPMPRVPPNAKPAELRGNQLQERI